MQRPPAFTARSQSLRRCGHIRGLLTASRGSTLPHSAADNSDAYRSRGSAETSSGLFPSLSTLLAGPHGPTVVCAVLGRVAAPGDGLSSDRPRGCVPPRISARPARPVCAAVGGLGGKGTVYIAAFRRKNSSACAAIVAALPWPCPHHMPCAYCHGTLLHPLPHSHRPLFFSAGKNFRQKQQACLVAYAW